MEERPTFNRVVVGSIPTSGVFGITGLIIESRYAMEWIITYERAREIVQETLEQAEPSPILLLI